MRATKNKKTCLKKSLEKWNRKNVLEQKHENGQAKILHQKVYNNGFNTRLK